MLSGIAVIPCCSFIHPFSVKHESALSKKTDSISKRFIKIQIGFSILAPKSYLVKPEKYEMLPFCWTMWYNRDIPIQSLMKGGIFAKMGNSKMLYGGIQD